MANTPQDDTCEDESDDDGDEVFYQKHSWLPASKDYDGEVVRARQDLRERAEHEKTHLRERYQQELRKFQRHKFTNINTHICIYTYSIIYPSAQAQRSTSRRIGCEVNNNYC